MRHYEEDKCVQVLMVELYTSMWSICTMICIWWWLSCDKIMVCNSVWILSTMGDGGSICSRASICKKKIGHDKSRAYESNAIWYDYLTHHRNTTSDISQYSQGLVAGPPYFWIQLTILTNELGLKSQCLSIGWLDVLSHIYQNVRLAVTGMRKS